MAVYQEFTTDMPWKKRHKIAVNIAKHKFIYAMMFPAIVWALIFCYAPIYGLYMAFVNYTPAPNFFQTFFTDKFVGLSWFLYFFTTGDFIRIMRNTLATSLITLIFNFPAPIILALVLNECRISWFKKTVQTVSYLPFFISWVICANIFLTMMSSNGAVNELLMALHITHAPLLFFQNGVLFWFIMGISNTWKGMGYSSIIFLAAISSINNEIYDAAAIDGAGRFQKMIYITLPAIMPTVAVMFVLSVGGLLNAGFEQQLLMSNATVLNYSDVIDTYSYRYGFGSGMYSYGAAVGLFKSIINFILLLIANGFATKVRGRTLV